MFNSKTQVVKLTKPWNHFKIFLICLNFVKMIWILPLKLLITWWRKCQMETKRITSPNCWPRWRNSPKFYFKIHRHRKEAMNCLKKLLFPKRKSNFILKNAENFSTKALAINVVLFALWWSALTYDRLKLLRFDFSTILCW